MSQKTQTYHDPVRKERAQSQREKMIDLYKWNDLNGLTIKEIHEKTGITMSTITARNSEINLFECGTRDGYTVYRLVGGLFNEKPYQSKMDRIKAYLNGLLDSGVEQVNIMVVKKMFE